MTNPEVYLHTTHRTVSWFKREFLDGALEIAPNFQRHAVWTDLQKSYLIDTILLGLPIPEIYMQDPVNANGEERHVIVDGQQRIRSVLEFVNGDLVLEGEDVNRSWRGRGFADLSEEEMRRVYAYKFVARILPPHLTDDEIRQVFTRINKNVEELTDQELRNATYSGPFIRTIKDIADDDPFWANCGVFSAKEYRRMNDQEFISELVTAFLYGPQNKKDKLDQYYQENEESFDDRTKVLEAFKLVTTEIGLLLPEIKKTRWRKKSDFYTMFLAFARRTNLLPFDSSKRTEIADRLITFGETVDAITRMAEDEWGDAPDEIKTYARSVARAASDRNNRINRANSFVKFVLQDKPLPAEIAVQKS